MPRNATAEEQFRSRARKALTAGKDFKARSAENKAILVEIRAEIEAGHKELELTTTRCKRKLSVATDAGISAIRSEVESGLQRLRRSRASSDAVAPVPVPVPAPVKLKLRLWAGARLVLRTPKWKTPTPPPPAPFVFDTAWLELHASNVLEAATRYAVQRGMTIGVVAGWFESGVALYFRKELFQDELAELVSEARRAAEEIFIPQRKACKECRRYYHGKYGGAVGCALHSSILDPRVVLGVEAKLRDRHLLDAAAFAVARHVAIEEEEVERLRLCRRQQVEEERTLETHSGVEIVAAQAVAEECRACGPCNELDWMMGSRCEVHESRYEEVCASMLSKQRRLCA
jgi:hypothetical protein